MSTWMPEPKSSIDDTPPRPSELALHNLNSVREAALMLLREVDSLRKTQQNTTSESLGLQEEVQRYEAELIRKAPKSQSAFLKNSQSVEAKTSATQALAGATDSSRQFVHNAKTTRDKSMVSASRLPESTRPPSTTRAAPATKPCPPGRCDNVAAYPCSRARIAANADP